MSQDIDNLIMRYSAGSLDKPMSLLMASYMTLEPEARTKLAAADDLNATLVETADPIAVNADMLDSLMQHLDDAEASGVSETGYLNGASHSVEKGAVKASSDVDIPAPLREFLPSNVSDLKWRFIYPGVKAAKLASNEDGYDIRLLKIRPGKAAPHHAHDGMEATLVLRGAFKDGDQIYSRGDLAIADGRVEHRPRAVGDDVCLCLAVTTGPLRFKDRFSRVIKDFIS